MEMNMEKPEIIRILNQTAPAHIMINQKQPENVEYFK
jgi:hypothetical protein